ncbi:hypothetical protein CCACVL1_27167, partial [Corchorus capsularis]
MDHKADLGPTFMALEPLRAILA